MISIRKPRRGANSITFNNIPQVIQEKVRSIGKPTRAIQVTRSRILSNYNSKETNKPVITNSKKNLPRKRCEDIAVNTVLSGKEFGHPSKYRRLYSKEIQTLAIFTIDSCTQYTDSSKHELQQARDDSRRDFLYKKTYCVKRWALSKHPHTGPDF